LESLVLCSEKIQAWNPVCKCVSRLVDLKVVHMDLLKALIRCGVQAEKIPEVLASLEKVMDRSELGQNLEQNQRAVLCYILALFLKERKIEAKELIPRFRQAADLSPEGTSLRGAAFMELAQLFEKMAQQHQAIKTLESVLDSHEQSESESHFAGKNEIESLFDGLPSALHPQWPNITKIHYRLGEMLEGKHPERAANHYQIFFNKNPEDRNLLAKLRKWYERWDDFENLEKLLDRGVQVELAKDNFEDMNLPWVIEGLHQIAALRLKSLDNPEGARMTFEQIIQLDFDDSEAHMALAALYDKNQQFRNEAIREHEWLLTQDPLRISSYRAILDHYRAQDKMERAACLADILVLLGEAFPDEERLANEVKGKIPHLRPGTVSEEARVRYLLDQRQNVYLQDLFHTLEKGLNKVYRFRMEKYPVQKSDRIGKSSPPAVAAIWQSVNDLYRAFGGKEVRIYWDRQGQNRLVLENDKVPALIISSDFFPALSELEQNFLVGRVLQYALDGFIVLQKINSRQLENMLQALLKKIDPDSTLMISQEELEEGEKTMSKLSRKSKKNIKPLLDLHVNPDTHVELEDWLNALKNTANRGGLLACGSLKVACDFLTREEGYDPPEEDKKAQMAYRNTIRKSKTILNLFSYAASRNYFTLRELLFES
jgi:tetratricopeptide (TPR) repeat protein